MLLRRGRALHRRRGPEWPGITLDVWLLVRIEDTLYEALEPPSALARAGVDARSGTNDPDHPWHMAYVHPHGNLM